MKICEIAGNASVKSALMRLVERSKIPPAMLFSGPRGVGKFTLAMAFVQAANCQAREADSCGECSSCRTLEGAPPLAELAAKARMSRGRSDPEEIPLIVQPHPDVWVLLPDPNFIRAAQMREVRRTAYFRPSVGGRRFFIFDEAEKLRRDYSDLLLKVLEEPPESATLILVTTRPNKLPDTVRSRCVGFRLSPLRSEEIQDYLARNTKRKAADREILTHLSAGSLGTALTLDLNESKRLRRQLFGYLQLALERGPYSSLFEITDNLLKGEQEPFENLLGMLYSLVNDLLHLKLGRSEACLRNLDLGAELERFAAKIDLAWIERAVKRLDEIDRWLRRNVNRRLALEAASSTLAGR